MKKCVIKNDVIVIKNDDYVITFDDIEQVVYFMVLKYSNEVELHAEHGEMQTPSLCEL